MSSKTNIVSDNIDATSELNAKGILKYPGTPQVLTGAGAVNLTTIITHLVTAGIGDAITLADGVEGQIKIILMKTLTAGGHTSVLTPAHFAQGATITFDAVDCIITMLFSNGTWHWTGGRNITLA